MKSFQNARVPQMISPMDLVLLSEVGRPTELTRSYYHRSYHRQVFDLLKTLPDRSRDGSQSTLSCLNRRQWTEELHSKGIAMSYAR